MISKDTQKGFTLLEVLIASAIFTLVLLAIYLMYETNQATYARGENKIDLQQNARVAMELMTREIRTAGYDPSLAIPAQASQTAIQTADANTITFIADVDGAVANDTEWVRYSLAGNQLIRDSSSWLGGAWNPPTATPNTSVLADMISVLTFAYFDDSDNPIAAPVPVASLGNIRRIAMGITVQGTAGGVQTTFPLAMDVRLRNVQ